MRNVQIFFPRRHSSPNMTLCVKGDDFLISLSRNYIFAMPSETVSIYAQCADIFPSSPFLPEYDALIYSDPELFLHSLQAEDYFEAIDQLVLPSLEIIFLQCLPKRLISMRNVQIFFPRRHSSPNMTL